MRYGLKKGQIGDHRDDHHGQAERDKDRADRPHQTPAPRHESFSGHHDRECDHDRKCSGSDGETDDHKSAQQQPMQEVA